MPEKEKDGVKKIDPSAPEGGSKEVAAPQPDFEKLYQEEVARSAQWKEAALKNKRQAKENREANLNETEDERVARLASEVSARVVTTVTEDSLLKARVPDPTERKLIKFYLDERIKRTGTSEEALEADIDFAISAANSKKNAVDNAELKRRAANDPRVVPDSGSSADRGMERKPHEWTPEQEKVLTEKARALRIDPEKFKADAWKNRSRTQSIA